MKINNLFFIFFFVFILSSCNKYLGTIEPNYEPKNTISDIFLKDTSYIEVENLSMTKITHPKHIDKNTNLNFEKVTKFKKIDQNTNILFFDNYLYLNLKNLIFIFDENSNIQKIKINLKKNENIILIFEYKKNIYLVTDRSKLFKLNKTTYDLISDFSIFIGNTPILKDGKLVIFSIFGEVSEIDLDKIIINKKGLFTTNHGVVDNYKIYQNNEYILYLYNSGTLLTLDKTNNVLKDNYYLEDLNILSTIGIFSDLLDTPFLYKNHLYFLDRSGLVSIFNPNNSNTLWEIDMSDTIIDYSFSIEGYLTLLTFNNINIYNQNGDLIKFFNHNLDNPISIFGINENLHIISENGIHSFDINTNEQFNFIKNKFTSDLDVYLNFSKIYIKDNNHLYILE